MNSLPGRERRLTIGWCLLGCFLLLGIESVGVELAPLGLLVYVLFVRLVERRRCWELRGGMRGLGEAALGMALGSLCVGVPLAVGIALIGSLPTLFVSRHLVLLAIVAVLPVLIEEPVFRGLVLRCAELRYGSVPALLISSVVFTALHYSPGTPLQPSRLILVFLLGLALGAAYILTRRLWLGIGLHAANNLAFVLVLGLRFASTGKEPNVGDAPFMIAAACLLCLAAALIMLGWRRAQYVSAAEAGRLQATGGVPRRGHDTSGTLVKG